MKMKAKDKFLKYCNMFKRELADLQKEIDTAEKINKIKNEILNAKIN